MTSSHDGGRLMEKSTSCEVRYTAPSTMMSRRTATGVLVVVILGPSSREREGNGHRAHAVGTFDLVADLPTRPNTFSNSDSSTSVRIGTTRPSARPPYASSVGQRLDLLPGLDCP